MAFVYNLFLLPFSWLLIYLLEKILVFKLMKKSFFLILSLLLLQALKAQDISGAWYAKMEADTTTHYLNISLLISDSGLSGKFDQPSKGVFRLPLEVEEWKEQQLRWKVPPTGATFTGNFDQEKDQIKGVYSQGDKTYELTWSREPLIARAQQLRLPLPYKEKEVRFKNRQQDIQLAGTLTLPEGKGPYPAAVLISGSGPQNRDEEILGHKPFEVLADYLSRRGIAVLRYDDRGVGQSGGEYAGATTSDMATDARAAVEFLQQQPAINSSLIGLIGHSEGGMIAPKVAAETGDVAFIVALAGMGVSNLDFYLKSLEMDLKAYGLEGVEYDNYYSFYEQVYRSMAETESKESLKSRLDTLYDAWLEGMTVEELGMEKEAFKAQEIASHSSDWYHQFLRFDVQEYYRQLQIPVLALNGTNDLQVHARQNLQGIREVLEASGNQRCRVVELEGVNHFFQTCERGDFQEIYFNPETFSPLALEEIGNWIETVVSAGKK